MNQMLMYRYDLKKESKNEEYYAEQPLMYVPQFEN